METGDTVYLVLTIIIAPVSIIIMALVTWWFIQQQGEKEDTERVGRVWARRDRWGEERCRQIINHEVAAGMNREMVKLAWGHPKAIQRQPGTEVEYWLYDSDHFEAANRYVAFDNGQVTNKLGSADKPTGPVGPWLVIIGLIGFALFLTAIILLIVFMAGG